MYVVAAWAIITGILEIATAVRLRRELPDERALTVSGIASILLGMLFVGAPHAGLVAWAWEIGAYALASGMLFLALAPRLREHEHRSPTIPQI